MVVGYCCIGVLCQGAGKQSLEDAGVTVARSGYRLAGDNKLGLVYDVGETQACAVHDIPKQWLSAVGLTEREQDMLVTMNDAKGKDFREIAAWISRNVKATD